MLPFGVAFFYLIGMKYREIERTDHLYYREKGNPDLPPLIIFHGLWGASDNWLGVARLLSEHFHVILPDCRNHGQSPHLPVHDYAVLSEDLVRFITRLRLSHPPFLAGHSMGGKALMYTLLQNAGIAAKAAILDVSPQNSPSETIHRELLEFIQAHPLDSFQRHSEIAHFIQTRFPDPATAQLLLKNIRKTANGFEWKVNAAVLNKYLPDLMEWPQSPAFTPYPHPILFIKGELSGYITPESMSYIRPLFPRSILKNISGASHRLHADAPETLSKLLLHFFL